MVKKISIIILCLLLAAVATTAVVLGLTYNAPNDGQQAGTTQGTTDSTTSENGGSSSNSSSSTNDSSSSGGVTNNGSNSNGGTVSHDTCDFVYFNTVSAGCESQGYDLYTCTYSGCPKTEKRNTQKAIGHDYKATVHNATCTTDWSQTEICNRCGDVKTTVVEDSKGAHPYEWTETKAATCTANGSKTGVCTNCGATTTATIPALGHSYGKYEPNNDATCMFDGTQTAECSACHDKITQTETGSRLGHLFENYTLATEKTCTQDATKKATCARAGCNATDTKVTDKAEGHKYKLYSMLDGGGCGKLTTLKYKCDECGNFDTETKILEHDIQYGICHWCHAFKNPKLSDSGDYWVDFTDMGSLNFSIDGKECAPWEGCYGTTNVWFVINSRDGDRLSFSAFVHQQNTRVSYGADFEYGQLRDEGLGFKGAEFEAVFTNLETGEEVTFKFDASYRISDDGQYAEFMIHGSYLYRDEEGNDHYDHCHASFIRIILDTV